MLGISGNDKDPTQNRSFTGDLSRMSGASSQMSGMGSNMMRSIARLWCHESTRVFGDRILMSEGELIQFFSNSIYYCPLTKLREGNVFTGVLSVILSTAGWWVCLVPGPFWGWVGGYAWFQIPSRVGMPGPGGGGSMHGPWSLGRVYFWGGWVCKVHPRRYTPWKVHNPPPLEGGYTPSEGTPQVLTSGGATESFRTHPTGMLSCYCLFF